MRKRFWATLRTRLPERVWTLPSVAMTTLPAQYLNALSGQQGDFYLNRNAFAIPQPFTLGNLGVYLPNVRGFGSAQEDISAIKRFRIRERFSSELRGDFFNAFNRRNLNAPVTDLTSGNFGRVTGQGTARVIQLGWRLDF